MRTAVFEQTLRQLGWVVGRNLQIDYRPAGGAADPIRRDAAELVALAPDVIVTVGSATVGPVQQATRTIPIVMVNVADPVGAGFVQSLARPGGNATGFTNFEYSMSGKWVELLKQIAPQRDARSGAAGFHLGGGHRPICCYPVGSAVAWS